LRTMQNVVLLPHIGSASVVTRNAMDQLVVDNLKAWFAGKAPLTPIAETPTKERLCQCGGSKVRIISAASPPCGLLSQSHTGSIACCCPFDSEVRKRGSEETYELRNRDTRPPRHRACDACGHAHLHAAGLLAGCCLAEAGNDRPMGALDRRAQQNLCGDAEERYDVAR